MPESWTVVHGSLTLSVSPTPFGHVGVFPEQVANWDWIGRHARGAKVLNLFAYTGGSTLVVAAAGAEVVHLDAAKSAVAWARRNAELSGLSAAPVRWIVEDARKFVARELRRSNRYDAVILDPPSYGHGAQGEAWKIEQHLASLLADCARLTEGRRGFVLLTCHSPGYGPAELASALVQAGLAASPREIDAWPLSIVSADGRELPCGAVARWPRS
jgi:23S rRNA (cytosine1962-C5)-methyltransferase